MPDSGDDFVVTISGVLSELVVGQQGAATAEQIDTAFAATGAQIREFADQTRNGPRIKAF